MCARISRLDLNNCLHIVKGLYLCKVNIADLKSIWRLGSDSEC
jgi:hypothetical protein